MSSLKAMPHKLHKSGDGQFNTMWAYMCDQHGLEVALEEGFFNTVRSNMIAGDVIRIMEKKDSRILSYCEAMVVEVTPKNVLVHLTMEPKRFNSFFKARDNLSAPKEPEPVQEEKYVPADGTVKWNPGKKKFDVIVNEQVMASVSNKEEAQAIARGEAILKND